MLDANGNYVYPWNHGETLTAASLNAAIAQSSGAAVSAVPPTTPAIGAIWYNPATGSISVWDGAAWQPVAGAGGPFLPLSGGTVTGPTTFASSLTLSGSVIWAGQTATGFGTGIGQVPLFTSRASVPTWETSNQFMINRAANVAANGADLWIRHAGAVSGGALTNVNKGLMVDYSVPATDANNNWATLSKITQASTSGGQAVAAYAQAWKTSGTGLTTALISEASDRSGNKSSLSGQLTSQEMDLGGTDVDDGANAQRFGGVGVRQLVHAVFSQPSTTVNSEYTMGIWFGTQTNGSAASYVDSLLGVQGNTTPTMIRNFLDSRGAIAPTGVTDPVAVVRASAGHIIDFNGGPSLTSAPGNYLQYTTTGGNRLRYMAGTSEWLSITDGGSITANGPLNYTATGGTTSRSAQDRSGQVIDIRDLGAACDGTTDDTAAWTAAFAKPSGTVIRVPQNCVTMVGNARFLAGGSRSISIVGDGRNSVIRLIPGTVLTNALFTWNGGTTRNVRVQDLTIDFNNCPPPAAIQGLLWPVQITGFRMSNVAIINCAANIYMVNPYNCTDVTVDGCYFQVTTASSTAQSKGFVTSASLGVSTNVRFINNVLVNTNTAFVGANQVHIAGNDISGWGVGAGIATDINGLFVSIIGNKCHDSNAAIDMFGINPNGIESWAKESVISGNACWNNYGNGIAVGGLNTIVVGNSCWDNNISGNVVGAGVSIAKSGSGDGSGSAIIANQCFDTAGRQSYGFSIGNSGIVGLTLTANDFKGSVADVWLSNASYLPSVDYVPRILSGDPTTALGAATMQYVQGRGSGIRLLYQSTTLVGNGADTTQDVLQTYSVPANTLASIGDRLIFRAGGSFTGSTDSKTAAIRFGGGIMGQIVGSTVSNQAWRLEGEIIKTGTNAQTISVGGTTNAAVTAGNITTMTRVDNAAIVLDVTGQNATNSVASSITCRYFTVDYVAVT